MVPSGPLVVRVVKTNSYLIPEGKPAMGNIPRHIPTLKAMTSRRGARRISLPVDIELTINKLTVLGVIRDVSFSVEMESHQIGVGFFHNEPLPLREPVICRTNSHTDLLPAESKIVLMWSLDCGGETFLSGGIMAPCDSGTEVSNQPSSHVVRETAFAEGMAV